MDTEDILAALTLGEGTDWEFKSAKGGVPQSLWETYSAMANTDGGCIVFGVEDNGSVTGLSDPAKVQKTIWNTLNNRGKVNCNLLSHQMLQVHTLEGKPVVLMQVPRAPRPTRPVYVGQNPLDGTFRRDFEGDYHCHPDEVRRMLADGESQSHDARIMEGFNLTDLDTPSIQQYRNRLSARDADHPWLLLPEADFLEKLGAYRRDRKTGVAGVTAAGLLMFGKGEAIISPEGIPQFGLDYRERLSEDPAVRWTDRLTYDGKWECNLFQFYQRVLPKLLDGLKVPFMLDEALVRKGETPVHEALREAVTNALVHADYTGQGGVIIEKYRDRFEFSNPGVLLLSREQILRGGVSECRNKIVQKMFGLLGYGEKAGSGYDKILKAWQSQNWRRPHLEETVRPDRVRVVLPMISLLPETVLTLLRSKYGRGFSKLMPVEVQALVTAQIEGTVSNSRLQEVTTEHPADLTRVLQGLTNKGMLRQFGQKRGTTYSIPVGPEPPRQTAAVPSGVSGSIQSDSIQKPEDSIQLRTDSVHFAGMSAGEVAGLRQIAGFAAVDSHVKRAEMRRLIRSLCQGRYLTAIQMGLLLNRNPLGLRHRFLRPMIREGLLARRYPDDPNRPDQAYTTAGNEK